MPQAHGECPAKPQAADIPIKWLSVTGLRGGGLAGWLLAPVRLVRALLQSWRVLRQVRPRLVVGMGGFVSGPGGVAAWLAGIPLVIHEQNAVAGMTNRWLARIASKILQGFDTAFAASAAVQTVGNPVRQDIRDLARPAERFGARQGPLRLLVIGGSLGALALNEHVASAIAGLPGDERPQVRHQAGARTLEVAQDAYAKAGVRAEVTPYIDDMAGALAWADAVICRAGALTVSELINVGLGAVFVPFPHAVDDHQTRNASVMVDAGAAVLLPQAQLDSTHLKKALASLGEDRAALLQRAEAARGLRGDDAVEQVLAICTGLIGTLGTEVSA
ncbi:MAG: undecaprenyldiphospho-muramoylpentapeptide beta-N-acetylglucosaminyltransferase [Pseudomonadota bacterium]